MDDLAYRAVADLEPHAYGVPIRKHVEAAQCRSTSIGAVYAALGRLEDGGWIVSEGDGIAWPERGGRERRYYRRTGKPREIETRERAGRCVPVFNPG